MSSATPKPKRLSALRETMRYLRDPMGFLEQYGRRGDAVRVELADRDLVLLTHPDHIRRVLVENGRNYAKPEFQKEALGAFLGAGLLLSEGDRWKRQRQTIQPAFYRDRVREYAGPVTACAERTVAEWESGRVIDVQAEMTDTTLDVITRTMFDHEMSPNRRERLSEAIDVAGAHLTPSVTRAVVPDWVPTPHNVRYWRAVRAIRDIAAESVADHDEAADDRGARTELLSRLFSSGMPAGEIQDHLVTLLLAGHETTALALTYAWFLLAQHPEAQEALRAELRTVLDERSPTVDDLPELPYTEAVIREAMRLYPPLYRIFRQPYEPDEVGGQTIADGTVVSMPQWIVHRDERWWDDPERFRPERWTGDRDRPEYAYFPFGGGARRCIGEEFAMLEMKLVVATVARRYAFELVSNPELDLELTATARPRNAVRVRVDRVP